MTRKHKADWLKPIKKSNEKSGHEKNLQNKRKKIENEKLSQAMQNFLKKKEIARATTMTTEGEIHEADPPVAASEICLPTSELMDQSAQTTTDDDHVTTVELSIAPLIENDSRAHGGENSDTSGLTQEPGHPLHHEHFKDTVDLSDPATWPTNLAPMRSWLKEQDAVQVSRNDDDYPRNDKGHRFNKVYFNDRKWLVYSRTTNSLFCFLCCIFSNKVAVPWGNYGRKGYENFNVTKQGIERHENSADHFNSHANWVSYQKRAHTNASISTVYEGKIQNEISIWRQVLSAIFEVVKFLAKNKLPFQGSSTNINSADCGLFMNLIKFLAPYNPILQEHLRRLKKGSVSYLSWESQNEFISLCGGKVRDTILTAVRSRKYFGIIFDSTPDTSKKEQVCQIIRSVACGPEGCRIEENFIDFIHTAASTGKSLSDVFIKKAEKDQLDMAFCRAQGYDNEPKMSGQYNGVQKWISDKFPFAVHTPCAAHSLNLVGKNVCKKIEAANLTMGKIQNVYNFFAGSTKRWEALTSGIATTLKNQNEVRWSNRWDAVNPLFNQFENIGKILHHMSQTTDGTYNEDTVAGASAQLKEIWNFRFYLSLKIWHVILGKIEITNKLLQTTDLDIARASKLILTLLDWLRSFRTTGYKHCLKSCISKANEMGVPYYSGFSNDRPCRSAPEFDITNPTYRQFETKYFNCIVDELIGEFGTRFDQMHKIAELFSFLWGNNLETFSDAQLEEGATKLSQKYPKDLMAASFKTEITFLKNCVAQFMPENKKLGDLGPLDILNILYKNHLVSQFPNVECAITMFLVMPVTIAEGERAFSKLKLIKNYLRSSMGQERLSDLGIISIEKELADKICFDDVVDKFATSKCRKFKLD